jgi:hypothetical protein
MRRLVSSVMESSSQNSKNGTRTVHFFSFLMSAPWGQGDGENGGRTKSTLGPYHIHMHIKFMTLMFLQKLVLWFSWRWFDTSHPGNFFIKIMLLFFFIIIIIDDPISSNRSLKFRSHLNDLSVTISYKIQLKETQP